MSARQYRHFSRIDYLADLVGADVAADLLKVSIERADTPLDVSAAALEIGTWNAGSIPVNPGALEIGTWNAGTLAVQEETPLDVSGATVPVDHQGVIDVSSRDGRNLGDVDVTSLPAVDITDDDARVLGDVNAAIDNTAQIQDLTTGTGSSSAAVLDLGPMRKDVDIFYDLSGSATVTVEVSSDTNSWRTFTTISEGSANADVAQMSTAFENVRVWADQNVNEIEIVSRGI